MPVTQKYFKAINFDLSTYALRKLFGESGRKTAYSRIRRHFESINFTHRQYSGYISNNEMSYVEAVKVCRDLFAKFPWLYQVTQVFDVTNIGGEFDMFAIMKEQLPPHVNNQTEILNL
jgi:virulence-associated protein VapD